VLDQDPELPTALVDFPGAPLPADPLTAPAAAASKPAASPRQRWRFDHPSRWLVAHDPSQVPGLLDAAHALATAGQWCVGWVAYEAAPGLDPHLPVKALPPGQPYAVWAVFDEAHPWDGTPVTPTEAAWSMGPWQADLADTAMQTQVERIRELIREGEVYQVNLTGQLRSAYEGQPASMWACFQALRRSQPAGYSLMLDARAACRAPGAVLSVSPELFFDWDGSTLTTRPMKGTAARQSEPSADQAAADHLRTSEKERAENLMIVDLLRNDLSRIAEVGSVRVPSLFDVQALPTVWQMTSTITASSRPGLRLSEAFAALFPCGSVTGAPKRQAMHHIARLERSERGVYCGATGLMAPGGRVTFNVPIRTVCLHTPPPPAPWSARCGIGSGITLDATGPQEAAEWRAKQAFLRRAERPFHLIESLRLDEGHIPRIRLHLARLARSAAHFGWPWPERTPGLIEADLLDQAHAHPTGVHKLRLLYGHDGRWSIAAAPLQGPGCHPTDQHDAPTAHDGAGAQHGLTRVALATQAMPEADDFIRHKTTRRQAYEAFSRPPTGHFDTLLFNADGQITEFTIGNVAIKLKGQWFTPPESSGLLPGVMRAQGLLDGTLHTASLPLASLFDAEAVALLNSVRGWVMLDLRHLQAQLQASVQARTLPQAEQP
jgi:para-aminobenzoate synthetase/4-amino-4-deoxychorismate lyase